jgi:hypothetical protein
MARLSHRWTLHAVTAGLVGSMGVAARAEVTFLTQQREIRAATSADANTQVVAATDFSQFAQTLNLSTPFQTPAGPATNDADTDIDCTIDPNAIRASGGLGASGGLNVNGSLETGEAGAFIYITFTVTTPTPITLLCTPRPSTDPRDEFELQLSSLSGGGAEFFLDETSPAQFVDFSTVLQPGNYALQFQVELSSSGNGIAQTFDFQALIPSPASASMLAIAGLLAARRRR